MWATARFMNGLALHYYCGSGKKSRSATEFAAAELIRPAGIQVLYELKCKSGGKSKTSGA
jgi:hypothetical protein